MARVLVTGGAGFIGSHLCRALVARGDAVICLDDLSTGRLRNITDLRERGDFTFVEHDVARPYSFEVEAIFNLACPASPRNYQRDPVRTLDTCYLGTRNALELARARGIPALQASTSEVYGDPAEHPQTEGYRGNVDPTGPRACYDEGKRVAESLCRGYADRDAVDVRIARIFNTYGPGMCADDGRVVPTFLSQIINRQPLTVFGDGQQTRSFCYVTDLVRGLLALMAYDGLRAEPVNLGNPHESTVAELARVVSQIGGRKLEIECRSLPDQDPRRRQPDITRARALLGWAPSVGLREGLAMTLAAMASAPDELREAMS